MWETNTFISLFFMIFLISNILMEKISKIQKHVSNCVDGFMAMVSLGLTLLCGWVWAEYQKSEGLPSLQSKTDRCVFGLGFSLKFWTNCAKDTDASEF